MTPREGRRERGIGGKRRRRRQGKRQEGAGAGAEGGGGGGGLYGDARTTERQQRGWGEATVNLVVG